MFKKNFKIYLRLKILAINYEKIPSNTNNIFFSFSYHNYKNSTKKIDDKIFTTKENLRILNKEFEKAKLEFDYLSSAEKLLEYQSLYFENELNKKDISEIKNIKDRFNDE